MRRAAPLAILVLVAVGLAGCMRNEPRDEARVGSLPYGWDEEAPEKSEIATAPFYVLTQSSSFLIKGASYARYVIRVDQRYDGVEVFFTSTNRNAPKDVHRPNVNDAEYHFELMQVRPLGKSIRVMDVNAAPAFRNASTGHAYTLTYIYGKGADYQYVAPFDGNPNRWHLEPGYYDIVVATDEKLTVGVNLKLGTPLWTTYYHPQELGEARAEALNTYLRVWPGATPRTLDEEFDEVVDAEAGETLNYFAFSNLVYRSSFAAVGPQGTASVKVDEREVPHRLEASGVNPLQPQISEAYAYAVSFNEAGPTRHELRTRVRFDQSVSVQSDLAAQMLIFAVALRPLETHKDIPRPAPS